MNKEGKAQKEIMKLLNGYSFHQCITILECLKWHLIKQLTYTKGRVELIGVKNER